jgi:methionyl-tRNA formyltransferase
MDEGVDTRLDLDQEEVSILENETTFTLYNKVNLAHMKSIKVISNLLRTRYSYSQDEKSKASYCLENHRWGDIFFWDVT